VYIRVGVPIIYGHRRHIAIDRALARGEYLPLSGRHTSALLLVGTVLGLSTVGLLVYEAAVR
jgi:hypothetical protein